MQQWVTQIFYKKIFIILGIFHLVKDISSSKPPKFSWVLKEKVIIFLKKHSEFEWKGIFTFFPFFPTKNSGNRPFYSLFLVAWPLHEYEDRVDLVLIETSLPFLCKYYCYLLPGEQHHQHKKSREVSIKTR